MSEFGLISDHGSDGEDEVMTPAEVLQKLEEAWLNEKFSPELLENKAEVVDCIMEQIHEMEDNIQRAKKGDFKVSIHKMEIDRIRFVLSSYLRTRLHKIEKYATYLLETENPEKPKMSQEEFAFAKEYRDNLENHMKCSAVRHMPQNLQALDVKQMGVRPNMDSYTFLRVNANVEGVMVEEETAESRYQTANIKPKVQAENYTGIFGNFAFDNITISLSSECEGCLAFRYGALGNYTLYSTEVENNFLAVNDNYVLLYTMPVIFWGTDEDTGNVIYLSPPLFDVLVQPVFERGLLMDDAPMLDIDSC